MSLRYRHATRRTDNGSPVTNKSGAHVADSKPSVGFIGLGDMGGRIAKRIANTDIATIVYDTRASACAELALCGAQVASDAAAVARGAEVVCICVVDDEQVIG